MAEEETGGQERTEAPTARRREAAREEGRVARSVELSAAAVLLGGSILLAGLGSRSFAGFATRVLKESASRLSSGPMSAASATTTLRELTAGFAIAALPFLLGLMAIVLAINLVQTRGLFAWKAIAPKLSNIDPLQGLRRIVSGEALFNLGKSIVKFVILSIVTYTVIARSWPELVNLVDTSPADIAGVTRSLILRLAVMTGTAFLAVAAIDYGFQWYKLEKSLRMTRQEVILENRDSEGDPMVKSRIRAMGRALARRRMMQAVPEADVVIVNPTRIAVALKYDTTVAAAPIVVAMGQRKLAERIKAVALAARVPVLENKPVARALLSTATVGKPIPPALYAAVAEILAYVYRHRASIAGTVTNASDIALATGRAA